MKKRIVLLLGLFSSIVANSSAQSFTLKGKLGRQAEGAKVILSYQDGGQHQYDSTIVKKGRFFLSGNITEPVKGYINLISAQSPVKNGQYQKPDNVALFIEPGKMTLRSVDGKLSTATIKGGQGQTDFVELQQRLKPANNRLSILMDSIYTYGGENSEVVAKIRKSSREVYAAMDDVKEKFVYDYPDSDLSLSLVKDRSVIIDADKFGPMFHSLSERLKNTSTAKAIAARLEFAKKLAIGQHAPAFTQHDTADVPVSLSSLKGKYVLIDFWASWCGPCREENPHLIKAYEKFRKNFEIIGISLDSQKAAWLQAIRQDGLQWIQLSDLKGFKNEVARQYDIRAVPQNFLVDPNGVIIAKNLRAGQLEEKLNELFKH